MSNKNFVIPDGMEYFMPNEAKNFEVLKQKALKILAKLDYAYVNPPIFDNLNKYSQPLTAPNNAFSDSSSSLPS